MLGTNHIIKAYDQDIMQLKDSLIYAKDLIALITKLLKEAILDNSTSLLSKSVEYLNQVKAYENQVEKLVTSIIALRQPFADDLRFVLASLKISNLLYSTSKWLTKAIGKLDKLTSKTLSSEKKDILISMTEIVNDMLKLVFDSFFNDNLAKDQQLSNLDLLDEKDTIVDNLYKGLLSNIYQSKEYDNFYDMHNLIGISKYIEKAADNINEIVGSLKYVITGENKDF